MIIGPTLGGLLANPTKVYPNLFGGIMFLERNPYFLPCACSSLFSFFGFIVGYFFLPETNKLVVPDVRIEEEPLSQDEGEEVSVTDDERQVLLQQQSDVAGGLVQNNLMAQNDSIGSSSKTAILAYALLAFMGIIAFEIIPLWTVSPPPIGFSWTSKELGVCLSVIGAVSFLCQIIVYPTISSRYDAIQLYKYPMFCYPLFYIFLPMVSNYFSNDRNLSFAAMGIVMGTKAIIDNIVVTSVMILVNFSDYRLIILQSPGSWEKSPG